VHVTFRVRADVPALRTKRLIKDFRRSLSKACERGSFRVVQYSIQRNHVHLIVEAQGKKALASGMKSIGARFARSVNRVFSRRGPVLEGRFHHRVLRMPREVRNALAYVLLNVRKHRVQGGHAAPPVELDDASSGRWFEGWKRPPPARGPAGLRDVAPARTWLLTTGWRRHGLIEPGEVPGAG
jgi:REP element-mobilizing transposase RayT